MTENSLTLRAPTDDDLAGIVALVHESAAEKGIESTTTANGYAITNEDVVFRMHLA